MLEEFLKTLNAKAKANNRNKQGVPVKPSPFQTITVRKRSQGSSVSIVSDYGLDNWGSIPNRGRGFFL
jgi:hypothetical protein